MAWVGGTGRWLLVGLWSITIACSGGSAPSEPSDDFSGDSGASGAVSGAGGTASGGTSTGGAGTGGHGDGGNSALGCAETAVTFTFDDEFEEDLVEVSGTPSSLVLRTALPMAQTPNFTLSIFGIDGGAEAPLTLPLADGPRIEWSLASNGSGLPSAIVSTMPSGGNQLAGDFGGTLILTEVGAEADDARCGAIALSLSYVDEADAPHTFTAEGSFQTLLSPPEMP